jgi:hypothetical protein
VADTLHSRAVGRASELLGGPEKLASRLGVSHLMIGAWMASGGVPMPRRVFLKLVDIILSGDSKAPDTASKSADKPAGDAPS